MNPIPRFSLFTSARCLCAEASSPPVPEQPSPPRMRSHRDSSWLADDATRAPSDARSKEAGITSDAYRRAALPDIHNPQPTRRSTQPHQA